MNLHPQLKLQLVRNVRLTVGGESPAQIAVFKGLSFVKTDKSRCSRTLVRGSSPASGFGLRVLPFGVCAVKCQIPDPMPHVCPSSLFGVTVNTETEHMTNTRLLSV
uniref:Uncharacterized protein n=1 Tax=Eutreptiella gymnastica TaxID=73025 RepID=A0A7S4G6E2_9EUGL